MSDTFWISLILAIGCGVELGAIFAMLEFVQ